MNKKEYQNTGYYIDEQGTVYGKYVHTLKPKLDRYGYLVHGLSVDGKVVHKTVHRMVAETFIPNPENKPVVNHIDGNKLNNHVDNLEWCTVHENCIHASDLDLVVHSEDSPRSSLTNEQVHEVCRMICDKYRNSDISKKTGVPRHTVGNIRNGNTWTRISSQYDFPKIAHQGFSMETFYWCCHKLQEGWSYKKILKHYTGGEHLTYSALKKIKARKMRPEYSKDFKF